MIHVNYWLKDSPIGTTEKEIYFSRGEYIIVEMSEEEIEDFKALILELEEYAIKLIRKHFKIKKRAKELSPEEKEVKKTLGV